MNKYVLTVLVAALVICSFLDGCTNAAQSRRINTLEALAGSNAARIDSLEHVLGYETDYRCR